MKHISILIKPASSLCNMACRYCFYSDVSKRRDTPCYGVMQPETVSALLQTLFAETEENGSLDIAFQGGEPTLAGLDFFRAFVHKAEEMNREKQLSIHYSIQTNGVLLDGAWCEFFRENGFLVGLSLDGPKALHDANRLLADGKGSFRTVMHAVQLLKRYRVAFNILCVLTKHNAKHPQQLWNFFMQNDLHYLQFIPCLPEIGEKENDNSLTPQLFYSFYVQVFRLWLEQLQKGNYVSVKLFDDMAGMFVHRRVNGCGMDGRCNLQYVVEADGGVYPCDFYVLDNYYLGNITKDSLASIRQTYATSSFHGLRQELPAVCNSCKYQKLCHGGCVRLRRSMYLDEAYCGYAHLLETIGDPLIRAALRISMA